MERFTTSLFLIMFICPASRCQGYEIIPDGAAWLGENLTLVAKISNIQRPVYWQSQRYKYICDRTCTDNDDFKVTQTGDVTTLLIRRVEWRFSNWKVLDRNMAGGQIVLDIKVKPKIEIRNTNCEYYIEALDSYPVTSIECFNENRPLQFTETRATNSSDGRTLSNVGTLGFTRFRGNVTCNFTLGEIFAESRRFQVECDVPPKMLTILESTFLFASAIIFTVMVVTVKFLCKMSRRNKEDLKIELECRTESEKRQQGESEQRQQRESEERQQRESEERQQRESEERQQGESEETRSTPEPQEGRRPPGTQTLGKKLTGV